MGITGRTPQQSVGPASEKLKGYIELATEAEALAGTDAERAITPATMKGAIDVIGNQTVKASFFATISSGTTSGTISKPAGGGADVSFIMDEWGTATDALVSKMENSKPTFIAPTTVGGAIITTTFDTAGNYAFSGTPSPAADHAVIYVYTCYLTNLSQAEVLFETELLGHLHSILEGLDSDDHIQYTLADGTRTQEFLQFNTSYGDSIQEGKLAWNSEDGTLEYGLPGGNVTLQIGQEQLVKVANKSGNDIADGKAVYVSGAQGSRPTIELADASAGTGKVPLGVTTEPIADDASGYVNVGGLVRDIDTSAISAGGIAFLSESTPGAFRTTPPAAPNYTTVVGYCLFSSADSGILFVRVLSAPRMQSLSDVDHTAPSDTEFYRWNNSNSRFELVTDTSIDVDLVPTAQLGTPTYGNLDDRLSLLGSAGRASGGEVSDAGSETVNVAAGTGFIKATDSDVAELLAFDWAASNGIAVPTDTVRYIGIIYNSGTPIVEIRSSDVYDLDTEFVLATVVNEGGTLHILNDPHWITDATTNVIERFEADGHLVRDQKIGGLILSAPATRRIAVTAGKLWSRLNEFDISAFTSVGDAAQFEMYWKNTSNVWADNHLYQYSVTTNAYNDLGEDTLQTLPNNRYANIWVYAEADNDEISLIYPQAYHTIEASAEIEAPPSSLPVHISENGKLIGRIIIQGGNDTAIDVQTAWGTTFSHSQAADHGNLAGLADDDHPAYLKKAPSDWLDSFPGLASFVDADLFLLEDSLQSHTKKKTTWSSIRLAIKALTDTYYAAISHATSHTDSSDDIQSATNVQKGVATAAQITALEAATAAQHAEDHKARHTDGNDDIRDATASQKGVATAAQITKLDGISEGAANPQVNLLTNAGFGVWSNSTLENAGSDLVTNGGFDSDTTGWPTVNCTIASIAGGQSGNCLEITRTGGTQQYVYQEITTEIGKLYKVTAYVKSGTSGNEAFILRLYSDGFGIILEDTQNTSSGAWVQYEVIFEATTTTSIITMWKNSATAGTMLFDTVVCHEAIPGCVAANPLAADDHSKTSTLDVFRLQDNITFISEFYGLKLVKGVIGAEYYNLNTITPRTYLDKFKGRTVTFALEVYDASGDSDNIKLQIYDGIGTSETSFVTSGSKQWAEVTRTINFGATEITPRILCDGDSTDVAYFNRAMLVFGSQIGEGNYVPQVGEIIYLEDANNILNSYNNVTVSANAAINLEAESNGQIPKGIKAIKIQIEGECATIEKILAFGKDSSNYFDIYGYSQVIDNRFALTGWAQCDANGDAYIFRDDTFDNVTIRYLAIQLQ